MLVYVEGGKPDNPEEKTLEEGRTNKKLNLHMALGQNQTQTAVVGGEANTLTTVQSLLI